jgi:hypothetical protein
MIVTFPFGKFVERSSRYQVKYPARESLAVRCVASIITARIIKPAGLRPGNAVRRLHNLRGRGKNAQFAAGAI